jgi:phospholipid/cholesterol/gamma-HCH transport system permease protein
MKMQPGIISVLGNQVKQKCKNVVEFYLFSISVFARMLKFHRLKGIGKTVLLRQIMFTGSDALWLIGFISLSTSMLVILEVHELMGQLGKGRLLYELLVLIIIRQLSSLLTAFVIIARSGTAISTELGNMVVHNEIDLLQSFGVSPFTYLAVPRMVGVVVSLFTLTLYFNFIAIAGGALVSNLFYDIGIGNFLSRLIQELSFADLLVPVIKSVLFGAAIGLVACYQGLKVSQASTEVPQRTMRAVVNAVVSIIALNVGITVFYR